ETVFPFIENDIVNMTNRAPGQNISDMPSRTLIGRGVHTHFVAVGIVEILSPKKMPFGSGCDVQRPCAAGHAVAHDKLAVAGCETNNRAWHGGHNVASWKDRQRVKAVTKQAMAQSRRRTQIPPPRR